MDKKEITRRLNDLLRNGRIVTWYRPIMGSHYEVQIKKNTAYEVVSWEDMPSFLRELEA